jgi:hypothetical protein
MDRSQPLDYHWTLQVSLHSHMVTRPRPTYIVYGKERTIDQHGRLREDNRTATELDAQG